MDNQRQRLVATFYVHKDILQSPQSFQSCPLCSSTYSKENLPNLLYCGHLICGNPQCFPNSNCYQCDQSGFQTQVRQYQFYQLFLNKISTIGGKKLIFQVTNIKNGKSGKLITNVTMEWTIRQIVEQCQMAKLYLESVAEQSQYFQLHGKAISYSIHKNTKLRDLRIKDQLIPIHEDRVNNITVQDRSLGGMI